VKNANHFELFRITFAEISRRLLHLKQLSVHIKWVTCQQGMARPRVVDGEDGLHICWIAVNISVLIPCSVGPCHSGMACPQVADGGDGLQIWRVAANILNKWTRIDDKGWPSRLGAGLGHQPYTAETSMLQNVSQGLRFGGLL
jgi:hypothetical protein